MRYAEEYLNEVLDLESELGRLVEEKMDTIVEKKIQQMLSARMKMKDSEKEKENEDISDNNN